jgi:hypothetical protein
MNQAVTTGADPTAAPDQIPTLTADMAVRQVPQAVSLALEARAAEKRALMALSDELVQNLRPEIERLAADLVQRTLQGVWDQRARIYQDT